MDPRAGDGRPAAGIVIAANVEFSYSVSEGRGQEAIIMQKLEWFAERGVLQGPVGGKLLTCVVQPGTQIPPGDYMLLPPSNDPIYGSLIRMVPAGDQGNEQAEASFFRKPDAGSKQDASVKMQGPAYASVKMNVSAQEATSKMQGAAYLAGKVCMSAAQGATLKMLGAAYIAGKVCMSAAQGATLKMQGPAFATRESAFMYMKIKPASGMKVGQGFAAAASLTGFVLTSKRVPGWNNLLVTFGFSDLVEALKSGGGMIHVR